MPATAGAERQEEDRQLFDLDKHRSQSRQQLLSCRGQIAMKQKAKRRAELFLSATLPSILDELLGLIRSSDDDLTTLQGQERYLVKDLDTTETSIEEIVGKEQKAQ